MNSFEFTLFLTSNIELDNAIITKQVQDLTRVKISKGDFLLRPGEYCKHSFYIEKGLLRYYFVDEKGKEQTIYFAPEGWFVSDRESICLKQPTDFFIEALEDSTIIKITDDFINDLASGNNSFAEFNNRLLISHIHQLQNRVRLLLGATAEERYLDFVKTYPDILLRVPQWMVASYLGITPEGLSRVRKDLAVRNFRS